MIKVSVENIEYIGDLLCNTERPLKERFRALFTLKNIGGPIAVATIQRAFDDESALLKHEVAYCLGQMREPTANLRLKHVLKDTAQQAIVRHEAAEALGAIGSPDSIPILEKFLNDPIQEVKQTCELALERIAYMQDEKNPAIAENIYGSVDPAPASKSRDVEELKGVLLDTELSMFKRYQAMFALRDMNTALSVKVLCEALKDNSALLKHEVAFVLGQLQDDDSIAALVACLSNKHENEMVRHECAEALGAIGSRECITVLTKYYEDENIVVRESCEVALDMCEYENSPEFQYANVLQFQEGDD